MSTKALYVHIPFCDHICGYCDFTRFHYARQISDQFMIRLIQQINALPGDLKTIYVGGGTPTSLENDQLEALLKALKPKLADEYEWTFEGNPENLTEENVQMLHDYGVNRMSLGVQTTHDDLLEKIGRHHKFYDVEVGVKLLRKIGIENISLDLMYGLPGQSLASFESSMRDVIALKPDHVSIYALTVEPNSLFGRRGIQPVPIELETEMFLSCIQLMESAGYEQYEISNFALPGSRSQHNQVYWRYEDFYALGPGSSLKHNHQRKTWTTKLGMYLKEDTYHEVIDLTLEDEMFEFMMMGLRLKDGVAYSRFQERFGVELDAVFADAISEGVSRKLLYKSDDVLKTTFEGFVMLDDTLLPFMSILND
ncbi:radical SAM family heme chaperone HemW [Erysipelothrix enhydrae]|uniref:radical SAM family heme chaperone HemW n=1 Tax=Erysipelothrix enhydrae TaxID=2890314 RepID=UPI002B24230A|nr:radical SAM family heme chaperone HemW [Erysipelothrix sp. 4322-04]WRB86488.1 radical SAM family heme chaperone HemW [Erysipelothrix sp. 4322-04]